MLAHNVIATYNVYPGRVEAFIARLNNDGDVIEYVIAHGYNASDGTWGHGTYYGKDYYGALEDFKREML